MVAIGSAIVHCVCRRNANAANMQVPLRQVRMPTGQRQSLAMHFMLEALLYAVHSEQDQVSRLRGMVQQLDVARALDLARPLEQPRRYLVVDMGD